MNMDKDEALRLIKAAQLMLLGKDNQPISDLYYALQIAIDSIEELTPQGDAISREALKEQINAIDFDFGDYYDNTEEIRKRVCEAIDNAPTVEPDVETDTEVLVKDAYEHGYADGWKERFGEPDGRPKGKWELHGMIYYCSECGHDCGESGDNFCGNCGADMRGGSKNE